LKTPREPQQVALQSLHHSLPVGAGAAGAVAAAHAPRCVAQGAHAAIQTRQLALEGAAKLIDAGARVIELALLL